MKKTGTTRKRTGAVLPMVAFCMMAVLGLVALAIDIGLIAIARNQCQNAADVAALAGARIINGDVDNNYNFNAIAEASIQAAIDNRIMGVRLQGDPKTDWNTNDPELKAKVHPNDWTFVSGQVQVEVGSYTYTYDDANSKNEGFKLFFPRKDSNEPYGAVRTKVDYSGSYAFAQIFSLSNFSTGATATAVHRPRDVVIIMDLSGSMRFQSLPAKPYYGSRTNSMNPESIFPEFGHYSDISAAALQGTTVYATGGGEYYDPANISTATNAGPTILEYFFKNTASEKPNPLTNRAFARASDSYNKTPGGDNFLKTGQNKGASYAKTVAEIVTNPKGDSTFDGPSGKGYDTYLGDRGFKGYTQGPGYWGKTFFIWPPDPRGSTLSAANPANHADNGAKDWRQRFFFKVDSAGSLGWLDQNRVLFDSFGYQCSPASTVKINESYLLASDTPVWQSKSYTYRPNYAAILKWLDTEPKPFPPILRAGRIKYYDAFPNYNDITLNNRWWTTPAASLANLNERFWKGYIDFVLGLNETGPNSWDTIDPYSGAPMDSVIGCGRPFTWGTVLITDKPAPYQSGLINKGGSIYAQGYDAVNNSVAIKNLTDWDGGSPTNPTSNQTNPSAPHYITIQGHSQPYKIMKVGSFSSSSKTVSLYLDRKLDKDAADGAKIVFFNTSPSQTYMNYADNPRRPRHHFWFGPMTMYDYLGNYNQNRFWLPGSIPEAQAWACKVGIQTAIDDIKNNHPNDFVGMTFFSNPKYSATGRGQHNRAVVPLGREYQKLKDSLWFPPSTVTGTATEITPWDPDFANVPRSRGGTAPGMGFMIAYNLLSSSTTNLRYYSQPQPQYKGLAGGLGRKGAARLIIFETDGAPNTRAYASIQNAGADSYYPIRIKYPDNLSSSSNVEWPSGGTYSDTDVINVVKQICALDTANPPGYSTKRKPAQVYCIGYGTLFDPKNSSDPDQAAAIQFFQIIQYYGNTSTTLSAKDFPANQLIYGTEVERISRMQAAFQSIMQGGVQVSLLE